MQLQQVAMNLIVNSIEAMKDVDRIRELVVKSQLAENEQILVTVSDTGPGFPPDRAERIFDPFFTTKPHGTGMGLRISRSIIESHGGRLWAEAAAGRGATFHFRTYPPRFQAISPGTPESIIVQIAGQNRKIKGQQVRWLPVETYYDISNNSFLFPNSGANERTQSMLRNLRLASGSRAAMAWPSLARSQRRLDPMEDGPAPLPSHCLLRFECR